MQQKIFHVGSYDKFTRPFIGFVEKNFNSEHHFFLMISNENVDYARPNVTVRPRSIKSRLQFYFEVIVRANYAKKIILHGLFDIKLVATLLCMPWVLKKCYWFMWGGDVYAFRFGEKNCRWQLREWLRRRVIRRIGNLVTYISGDVDLARLTYGAVGQHHECLMYLSNVYDAGNLQTGHEKAGNHSGLKILVGNSADPSNNHLEILEKLLPYRHLDIKVCVPLSYGDRQHARHVIEVGQKWFGSKFIPISSFMPFNRYLEFLSGVDIAVFNHERQQAMGNLITLIGMGKTVFMRSGQAHYDFMKGLGVKVRAFSDLNLKTLEDRDMRANEIIIRSFFTKEKLRNQLSDIFEV